MENGSVKLTPMGIIRLLPYVIAFISFIGSIYVVRSEVANALENQKTLKVQVEEVRKEIKQDIKDLRQEVLNDIKDLRKEVTQRKK